MPPSIRVEFLRLSQIVGNPKADPPIPALLPIGRSTWLRGVANGRYPKPVRLGPNIVVWRVSDIQKFIDQIN